MRYELCISSAAISVTDFGLACLLKTYLIITKQGKPINAANGNAAIRNVMRPRTKLIATSSPEPKASVRRVPNPAEFWANTFAVSRRTLIV
jgi:hypothetical protein